MDDSMNEDGSWRTKAMVAGVVLGALAGAGAAYLLIKNAENQNTHPEVTPGDGVKLGLMILGMLRQVAEMGSGK